MVVGASLFTRSTISCTVTLSCSARAISRVAWLGNVVNSPIRENNRANAAQCSGFRAMEI